MSEMAVTPMGYQEEEAPADPNTAGVDHLRAAHHDHLLWSLKQWSLAYCACFGEFEYDQKLHQWPDEDSTTNSIYRCLLFAGAGQ